MVKPELLLQNPDWFESGRVAHSGVAWGEDLEPKELTKDRKGKGKGKASTEKLVIRLRRPRADDGEASTSAITAAQAKIGEILGGVDDADMLFD